MLWKERGIGDKYIAHLYLSSESVVLSMYVDHVYTLYVANNAGDKLYIRRKRVKARNFDYHLPLGSVPGLVRNNIRDFDRTVTGHFKADPARVDSIRKELKLDGKTVMVSHGKVLNH